MMLGWWLKRNFTVGLATLYAFDDGQNWVPSPPVVEDWDPYDITQYNSAGGYDESDLTQIACLVVSRHYCITISFAERFPTNEHTKNTFEQSDIFKTPSYNGFCKSGNQIQKAGFGTVDRFKACLVTFAATGTKRKRDQKIIGKFHEWEIESIKFVDGPEVEVPAGDLGDWFPISKEGKAQKENKTQEMGEKAEQVEEPGSHRVGAAAWS